MGFRDILFFSRIWTICHALQYSWSHWNETEPIVNWINFIDRVNVLMNTFIYRFVFWFFQFNGNFSFTMRTFILQKKMNLSKELNFFLNELLWWIFSIKYAQISCKFFLINRHSFLFEICQIGHHGKVWKKYKWILWKCVDKFNHSIAWISINIENKMKPDTNAECWLRIQCGRNSLMI